MKDELSAFLCWLSGFLSGFAAGMAILNYIFENQK